MASQSFAKLKKKTLWALKENSQDYLDTALRRQNAQAEEKKTVYASAKTKKYYELFAKVVAAENQRVQFFQDYFELLDGGLTDEVLEAREAKLVADLAELNPKSEIVLRSEYISAKYMIALVTGKLLDHRIFLDTFLSLSRPQRRAAIVKYRSLPGNQTVPTPLQFLKNVYLFEETKEFLRNYGNALSTSSGSERRRKLQRLTNGFLSGTAPNSLVGKERRALLRALETHVRYFLGAAEDPEERSVPSQGDESENAAELALAARNLKKALKFIDNLLGQPSLAEMYSVAASVRQSEALFADQKVESPAGDSMEVDSDEQLSPEELGLADDDEDEEPLDEDSDEIKTTNQVETDATLRRQAQADLKQELQEDQEEIANVFDLPAGMMNKLTKEFQGSNRFDIKGLFAETKKLIYGQLSMIYRRRREEHSQELQKAKQELCEKACAEFASIKKTCAHLGASYTYLSQQCRKLRQEPGAVNKREYQQCKKELMEVREKFTVCMKPYNECIRKCLYPERVPREYKLPFTFQERTFLEVPLFEACVFRNYELGLESLNGFTGDLGEQLPGSSLSAPKKTFWEQLCKTPYQYQNGVVTVGKGSYRMYLRSSKNLEEMFNLPYFPQFQVYDDSLHQRLGSRYYPEEINGETHFTQYPSIERATRERMKNYIATVLSQLKGSEITPLDSYVIKLEAELMATAVSKGGTLDSYLFPGLGTFVLLDATKVLTAGTFRTRFLRNYYSVKILYSLPLEEKIPEMASPNPEEDRKFRFNFGVDYYHLLEDQKKAFLSGLQRDLHKGNIYFSTFRIAYGTYDPRETCVSSGYDFYPEDTLYYRDSLDGKVYCFGIPELLEAFSNGNHVNRITGRPFDENFIQRVLRYYKRLANLKFAVLDGENPREKLAMFGSLDIKGERVAILPEVARPVPETRFSSFGLTLPLTYNGKFNPIESSGMNELIGLVSSLEVKENNPPQEFHELMKDLTKKALEEQEIQAMDSIDAEIRLLREEERREADKHRRQVSTSQQDPSEVAAMDVDSELVQEAIGRKLALVERLQKRKEISQLADSDQSRLRQEKRLRNSEAEEDPSLDALLAELQVMNFREIVIDKLYYNIQLFLEDLVIVQGRFLSEADYFSQIEQLYGGVSCRFTSTAQLAIRNYLKSLTRERFPPTLLSLPSKRALVGYLKTPSPKRGSDISQLGLELERDSIKYIFYYLIQIFQLSQKENPLFLDSYLELVFSNHRIPSFEEFSQRTPQSPLEVQQRSLEGYYRKVSTVEYPIPSLTRNELWLLVRYILTQFTTPSYEGTSQKLSSWTLPSEDVYHRVLDDCLRYPTLVVENVGPFVESFLKREFFDPSLTGYLLPVYELYQEKRVSTLAELLPYLPASKGEMLSPDLASDLTVYLALLREGEIISPQWHRLTPEEVKQLPSSEVRKLAESAPRHLQKEYPQVTVLHWLQHSQALINNLLNKRRLEYPQVQIRPVSEVPAGGSGVSLKRAKRETNVSDEWLRDRNKRAKAGVSRYYELRTEQRRLTRRIQFLLDEGKGTEMELSQLQQVEKDLHREQTHLQQVKRDTRGNYVSSEEEKKIVVEPVCHSCRRIITEGPIRSAIYNEHTPEVVHFCSTLCLAQPDEQVLGPPPKVAITINQMEFEMTPADKERLDQEMDTDRLKRANRTAGPAGVVYESYKRKLPKSKRIVLDTLVQTRGRSSSLMEFQQALPEYLQRLPDPQALYNYLQGKSYAYLLANLSELEQLTGPIIVEKAPKEDVLAEFERALGL